MKSAAPGTRSWACGLDATGAEIESAYHARLAAADRVRFDSNASPADRRLG